MRRVRQSSYQFSEFFKYKQTSYEFQLNSELLADIKEVLIYSSRLAIKEKLGEGIINMSKSVFANAIEASNFYLF